MRRSRSKLCAYPNGAVPRFVGLKSDTAVRVSQNSFSFSEDGAKTSICEMSYGNQQDTRALLSFDNLTDDMRQPVPSMHRRGSWRLRRSNCFGTSRLA